VDEKGKPLNVKGICANAKTHRIYVSTIRTLMAFDLVSEKLLWEKPYEDGCDRMALSPDGKIIYLPSLEKDHWHVVDAMTGDVIKKLVTHSGSHNTVIGQDGRFAYLAGLKSPILRVADAKAHELVREIGPFSNFVRPFTVNGHQTLCYVNVNDLLGFEIGDLKTGKMLHRIEVKGFEKGTPKRHGCPSHGIGLTPDEKELWVTSGHWDKFRENLRKGDAAAVLEMTPEQALMKSQLGATVGSTPTVHLTVQTLADLNPAWVQKVMPEIEKGLHESTRRSTAGGAAGF
jgi:hypothetical protein